MASEEQSASTKWSQDLLAAFPVIIGKSEAGLQVVKDISEFYKARAKIEDEYAKKLAALNKTAPGSGFFTKEPAIAKEYKTLREALMAIMEKGVKSSEVHQEFSNKINNEICKNLDNWVKNKTNERVKIVSEGQKFVKTVADAKANVTRTKAEYERLMKEADVAKEQFLKAEKDETSQPDNKKLPPITKKASEKSVACQQKGKAAEAAYQAAVKKANEELANRAEKMPAVTDSLQKWEEERWNTLLASVRAFKAAHEAVPQALEQQLKELVASYEAGNIEEDLREFVEANKKTEPEETVEFVAFKSKYEEEGQKAEQQEQKHQEKTAEAQPAETEEATKTEDQVPL